MFHWVAPFMWMMCRVIAFVLQFIGFTGILVFSLIGIWWLAGRI